MTLELDTSIGESNNAGTFEDDTYVDLSFTKNSTK